MTREEAQRLVDTGAARWLDANTIQLPNGVRVTFRPDLPRLPVEAERKAGR